VEAKGREKSFPPPRALPNAPVARVRLTAAKPAETRAFFDLLAEALGWSRLRPSGAPGAELRYGAGSLELRFRVVEETAPRQGASFDLEAPSAAAVEALHQKLLGWGAEGVMRPGPEAVGFRDPEGNGWTYAYHPA
jgi:hypothetical protein